MSKIPSAWNMDSAIIQSSAIISTTGGFTWPAARRLASYIEETRILIDSSSGSCPRILELGSGTGWLGITLALNLPHVSIVMTEQEEGGGTSHLQNNVDLNRDRTGERVKVCPCDWRDYSKASDPPVGRLAPDGQPWDLLIGSDLIYVEAGAVNFPRVIAHCMTRGHTRVLYCHTKHRFDNLDIRLEEELAKNGLEMKEVGAEASDRPPSPPPLTELFPEQRVVVYEIKLS